MEATDPGPIADRIRLRGMEFPCRIGVLPGEADAPQPLGIRVEVGMDLQPAARSDRLADTLDYSRVVEAVRAVTRERRFGLLEAVALAIVEAVLGADPRAQEVVVEVEKMRPPLGPEAGPIAVRLARRRGGGQR